MAIQFQNRRGTTSENNAFAGAAGEFSVDITNKRVRVHDGVKVGGFPIGDYTNAKDYGVVSDGVTDTTVAAQDLLDAHDNVFFPAGIYHIKGLVGRTGLSLKGERGTIFTSLDGTNILSQGTVDSAWGTGGSLHIENIIFSGSTVWSTLTPALGDGLVELYSLADVKFNGVSIEKAKSSSLYIKNIGYTSFDKCNFLAANYDCLFLNSTSALNSTTSTHVTNCRISTGLRSSVHLHDVFNVSIQNCQLEDSETALLIDGTSANANIIFKHNYVEATRGDYDIDFRTASGSNVTISNNYLFGTPTINTLGINTNGAVNFTPIEYSNNKGISSQPLHLGFTSIDWLKGARSSEGTAEITLVEATTAAQQTSRVNISTENNYGAAIKASSIDGSYKIGMERGTGFDSTDDGQCFISQTSANRGGVNIAPTQNFAMHIYGGTGTGKAMEALKCSSVAGDILYTGGLGYSTGGTPNATAACLNVKYVAGAGRSINAAGSINASGADYAEYMLKDNFNDVISKGELCGITATSKLTKDFTKSISFAVKSTDPSYVGNDKIYTELLSTIGVAPEMPSIELEEAEEDYQVRYDAYLVAKDEYDIKMNVERAKVDRIAFAGQVPINVLGATAGQYIIPTNDNGKIIGTPITNPTFEEYKNAVGKVIKIDTDGRAIIIVKIV